jgi:hypothetical protein
VDRAGKPSPRQPANVQILDRNQTEARNQPETELVVKVPSLVFDFPLCLGQQYRRFLPPVAPRFTACQFPLCPPQPSLSFVEVSRVIHLATIGERGEALQPDIDTHLSVAPRQGLGKSAFDREANKPLVDFAFDGDRLNGSFDLAMQFDLDFPGTLDTELPVFYQPASVAI